MLYTSGKEESNTGDGNGPNGEQVTGPLSSVGPAAAAPTVQEQKIGEQGFPATQEFQAAADGGKLAEDPRLLQGNGIMDQNVKGVR